MNTRTPTIAVIAALSALAMPGVAAAKSKDRDHDKMPDRWELRHGLSPRVNDAAADPDGDGLSNLGEYRSKTDPQDADTNNNGRSDADEDRDRDHVDNGNEIAEHTSPTRKDTNRNGISDGNEDADHDGLTNAQEDATGNDPVDADTDGDGVKDGGEKSGVITGFADGVLTIELTDGSTVSGLVDPGTEISCETEDEHERDNGADSRMAARSRGEDDTPDATTTDSGSSSSSDSADQPEQQDGDGTDSEQSGDDDIDHGDSDNVCTTADLVAGVEVHEAKLAENSASPTFEEISIIK